MLAAKATGRAPYVQQFSISLNGIACGERYLRAWETVLRRHVVFRFRLVHDRDGQASWMDTGKVNARLKLTDWRGREATEAVAAVEDFRRADRAAGLDPWSEPLTRIALFQLPDDVCEVVWTSHHALFDGRSRAILLREVTRACDGQILREPAPSFHAYSQWATAKHSDHSAAFWASVAADAPDAEPLPWQIESEGEGGEAETPDYHRVFEPEWVERLRSRAKALGVTPNTLVQGAWALLLSRVSRQETVCFGAPRACRNPEFPGMEGLVGLVMNVVPVLVRVSPDIAVGEYLLCLRQAWREMRPHERHPVGEMSFHSLLNCDHRDSEGDDLWPKEVAQARCELRAETAIPINLQFFLGSRGRLHLSFDPARYSRSTIEAMAECFVFVLEQLLGAPDRRLSELSLARTEMPAAGLAERLAWEDWESVAHRFAEMVHRYPDRQALTNNRESLTYVELDAATDRLAAVILRDFAPPPDGRIVICAPRSLLSPQLFLAVLKVGCVYVPLDPGEPEEPLATLLADVAPALIIHTQTAPACLGAWPSIPLSELLAVEAARIDLRSRWRHQEAPAYLVFTSGSTGQPKAVVVPHRGILRLVIEPSYLELSPETRMLHCAAPNFDATTLEIWGALLNGGCTVVYETDRVELTSFAAATRTGRTNTGFLTAAFFNLIVRQAPEALEPFRQLSVGGETLAPELIAEAQTLFPNQQLFNGYGPTENTTFSTFYKIPAPWPRDQPVPIGTPISGSTGFVLDACLQPVPIGVAGELCVGGSGLALGYWNREEITRRAFVQVERAGRRVHLYRTGDLVRSRPDGVLDFLGRLDNQVKIRGFRIELDAVQHHVSKCSGVRESAVRVLSTPEKRLVAWVIPAEGHTLAEQALRAELARKVPHYLVPSAFVVMESFPLNRNGKVDRQRLPIPATVEANVETPPDTDEARLQRDWLGLLPGAAFSPDLSFFHAGGDSLTALRLIARLRQTFGVLLPVGVLYAQPTPTELLAQIHARKESAAHETPGVPAQPTLRIAGKRAYPATDFLRQRYFANRVRGNCEVLIARGFRLEGELDVPKLKAAISQVINARESLRMSLVEHDGALYEVVADRVEPSWHEEDFSRMAVPDAEAELLRHFQAAGVEPIPYAREPLMKLRLLKLPDRAHGLILSFAHDCVDGISLAAFLAELTRAYKALIAGEVYPLPVETHFTRDDFAERVRLLASPFGDRLRAHWKEALRDSPRFVSAHERLREVPDRAVGPVRYWRASGDLQERVRVKAAEWGASPFVIALTAWSLNLACFTGSPATMAFVPCNGRANTSTPAFGDLMGRVYLRTKIDPDASLQALSARVRAELAAALEFRFTRISDLPEEIRNGGFFNNHRFAGFTFVDDLGSADTLRLPGLRTRQLLGRRRGVAGKLHVVLRRDETSFHYVVTHPEGLYESAAISRLMHNLVRIYDALLTRPALTCRELTDELKSAGFALAPSSSELAAAGFSEIEGWLA